MKQGEQHFDKSLRDIVHLAGHELDEKITEVSEDPDTSKKLIKNLVLTIKKGKSFLEFPPANEIVAMAESVDQMRKLVVFIGGHRCYDILIEHINKEYFDQCPEHEDDELYAERTAKEIGMLRTLYEFTGECSGHLQRFGLDHDPKKPPPECCTICDPSITRKETLDQRMVRYKNFSEAFQTVLKEFNLG